MTSIKKRTSKILSESLWIFSSIAFNIVYSLVVVAILSRKLDPNEFGLFALAAVFIELLTFISSQGINEYIIYDPVKVERKERINSAFWLDIVFGLSTFLICVALIPLFIRVYPYEELSVIIFLMALRFPFEAISRVPDALFKKELNFKFIEIRDSVISFSVALGSIIMALNGFGVWSLVIPSIFASPIRAIIVFFIQSSWRPKLNLGISYWSEIFMYSRNINGITLISFIMSRGDTLLIGKLLGPSMLGIYNIAWKTANMVNRSLLQITNTLSLPLLAQFEGDEVKLSIDFKKIVSIIGITAFTPIVGLFVVADVFVLVINGDKWMDAILPLRILLIYAMIYSVSSPIASVFKALGKPQIDFKIGLFIVPFYFIGIYFGSSYGIVGVAVGVTIVRAIYVILSFFFVAKVLNEFFLAIIRPILQPLLLSFFLGVFLILVRLALYFIGLNDPLILLLISVLVGAICFWLLLRFVFRSLSLIIMYYLFHIVPTKAFMFIGKLLNQK